MRLSRDESAVSLIKNFSSLGYEVSRQKGSYIRLSKSQENIEHHITIPNRDPIKIGLLSKILKDVAKNLDIDIEEL
ncbi:MAG: type II toxin-antitoxin system HicA family toxin [Saprospiraceae bacterium]|jgi:predicted RNA binding protein YcfA (HicA-like mRNA interferase family)|nr:type II toxin-antitoxin system HicA family toxin [Saprospiraceae bacterium]